MDEATAMIAEAAMPAKRGHKAALEQTLRQVEQENAALQEQYMSMVPSLQQASAEIDACKALVEKTATTCESWRASHA